jgi:hypothetical protein
MVARVLFLAGIAFGVVWGLLWALNPDPSAGIGFVPGRGQPAGEPTEEADPHAPAVEPGPDVAEAPTDEPTDEPTEDPQELMAAARPPGETSVQVLDAGGGRAAMEAAAGALREAGYNVVNTTSSRSKVEQTTVWFSEGEEPQAKALRAREQRVVLVGRNERLHEGVNLHLLVGPDWR